MPTHSLLQCVESPDGLAQDILISNNASSPGPGCSMTPHVTCSEKVVLQSGGSVPLSCMFCDQTFSHQDELGPHVLTQHPTTFFEPTVLRVEAEFRIPGERPRPKPSSLPIEKEEVHSCIVCGQVSQDANDLEAHMRKHKDYFTYCCNVCGRRFREPWFLKNHMKMHVKTGGKNKAQQDLETPVTVNGVIQDPPPEPVVTVYKMCMVCGFFFPDHEALVEHSKVHNRELDPGKDDSPTASLAVTQKTFLQRLGLHHHSNTQAERLSKWIPQLDPFNTYQAWQLATKGKVAVGPNHNKDTGQEASTDNEECSSDKEESSSVWAEGQGDKSAKEVLGRELRSQTVAETPDTPRRSLMQKTKDKQRPTTCEECQRTFRTYHQLVLHSRVHKRERGGEESPSSVDGKLTRLEHAEESTEEVFEDPALSENLGEDGFDRSKVRSKECNYCGKSFRSSYYLTIHLRTHTGEKPYKCVYCDYAAAQKTSLKYHLDRRHKDKPYVEIPSRPLVSSPTDGKHGEDSESLVYNGAGPAECNPGTPEDSLDNIDGKLRNSLIRVNAECEKLLTKPAHSPTDDDVQSLVKTDEIEENSEVPLNLSFKVSLSITATAEPNTALPPVLCPFCSYKTFYPEVLVMHRRLVHKDKSVKKTGFEGSLKQRRLTGCPPALDGKDVTPLPVFGQGHPRRTKSPLRQPAKPQEKTPVNPPPVPVHSPVQVPLHGVQEIQHPRHVVDAPLSQESSRYTEISRKSNVGSKYFMDRPGHPDRAGSYPARGGVIWHSDAARLCLSSRFGTLPHLDFGEPSSKRLKYTVPPGSEADTGEKPVFRGPVGDGSSRLLLPGRHVKSVTQASSTVSENHGPMKTAALGGGLDSDWSMMNLLHSYTPNDLASLYHSTPTNPSHGGLANPRGGITVLYQHLPTLPNLQRDPSVLFPSQRYGTHDKST